jgi:O-antigen/teichoic acid export membrane protein
LNEESILLQRIKTLTQSRFLRNVAVVASGAVGVQLIGFIFMPFITRIYGPEAFGLLGSFVAILAITLPIAALTYPIAIVLPENDEDAIGLAKLSLGIASLMAGLFSVCIFIFGDWLVVLLKLPMTSNYLLLIPLAMLCSAFLQIIQQWLIRKEQFVLTARIAVLQALGVNSLKLSAGYFYPVGLVLVMIAAIASAIHSMMLWYGVMCSSNMEVGKLKNIGGGNQYLNLRSLRLLAVKYKNFPVYQMPQIFMNAASQSIPVLLLASFYGAEAVGYYVLAKTVVMLPAALIAKSVGNVIYPKLNEIKNKSILARGLIVKATLMLFSVGLIPLFVIFNFGEVLFTIVFGDDWSKAGEIASWLSIWMFFSFLNPPSLKVIIVYNKQRFGLALNLFSLIVRVLALYLSFLVFDDLVISIIFFTMVGVLHNLLVIVFAYIFSGEGSEGV